MDWFERRIVSFMLLWAPFGTPPEDEVFVRFGVQLQTLDERFAGIVHRSRSAGAALSDEDAALLRRARILLQRRDACKRAQTFT